MISAVSILSSHLIFHCEMLEEESLLCAKCKCFPPCCLHGGNKLLKRQAFDTKNCVFCLKLNCFCNGGDVMII